MKISFLVVTTILLCTIQSSSSKLQGLEHFVKKDGSVSFLVIGDWGRRGQFNQSQVALQMGLVGEKLAVDFVISTGDNFYDEGLTGVYDPSFHASFTNIYTAPSLQKRWYSVLGNHDYMGNIGAQLSPTLARRDQRWICMRSFTLTAGVVEFFFIDTTPFVDKYFKNPGKHIFDWENVLPRENYLSTILQDLDSGLKNSEATWKIVVGHHGIKSAGHHGNTQELEDRVLPILEANHVDMYLNGHDHCLQHIISSNSKIQFLTSGGGSKAWRGDIKNWDPKELKLMYDGQGFVAFQMTKAKAEFVYYDVHGNAIHSSVVVKDSGRAFA